ncbi:MAG: hypothetical protein U5N55_12330 [Cypionkella sp.]|nr:hypothetical protein [Cypionkella sp.]
MSMIKNILAAFSKDESGAVTVDFVVLTAAVVVLGGAAATAVGSAISTKTSALVL